MGQVRYACERGIYKGLGEMGQVKTAARMGYPMGCGDMGQVKSVAVGMIKTEVWAA